MSNSAYEVGRLTVIANHVLSVGGTSIFICGIIGNLMNLIAFVKLPQFNAETTSIFLLTSHSGSLFTLLTGLLPQLVYSFTGHDPLVKYVILCKLRWFLGIGTATVAIHALCFAIFNQYLVTTQSVRCRQWMTRPRAIILCVLVYLYCAVLVSPNLVYYTHVINVMNQTTCDVTNLTVAVYNVYYSVIIYTAIPIFTLTLLSLLTWKNLRNRSNQRHSSLKRAVARMLFAQILIVLIAAVAFCTRRIYILYTAGFRKDSISIAQDRVITNVSTLFGFSIHGFTFFIYLAISKSFRKKFLRLLFCRHHRIAVNIVIRSRT